MKPLVRPLIFVFELSEAKWKNGDKRLLTQKKKNNLCQPLLQK